MSLWSQERDCVLTKRVSLPKHVRDPNHISHTISHKSSIFRGFIQVAAVRTLSFTPSTPKTTCWTLIQKFHPPPTLSSWISLPRTQGIVYKHIFSPPPIFPPLSRISPGNAKTKVVQRTLFTFRLPLFSAAVVETKLFAFGATKPREFQFRADIALINLTFARALDWWCLSTCTFFLCPWFPSWRNFHDSFNFFPFRKRIKRTSFCHHQTSINHSESCWMDRAATFWCLFRGGGGGGRGRVGRIRG